MRVEEAQHIGFLLKKYTGNRSEVEVLLNLGSSTGDFRKVQQPQIQENIFSPLEGLAYRVIHFDLKSEEGIDISGDIFDLETQYRLKKVKPTIVMCCNLLEHLEEKLRNKIQNIFDLLLEKDGVLIITVPHSYPIHLDPIDTYFRPTPGDLSALFPSYDILDESIVLSSTFLDEFLQYTLFYKIRIFMRLFAPFYKYPEWKGLAHRFFWLFREYKVSCVMLRKN